MFTYGDEWGTCLSLTEWCRCAGFNPWHFFGLAGETYFPGPEDCDNIWLWDAWRGANKIGRYDLLMAIKRAEENIASELRYWPGPVWISGEEHPYPQWRDPSQFRTGMATFKLSGKRLTFPTTYGKILNVGVEKATLILANVAITYSDVDGDGWEELGTITVATTITDKNEIALYPPGLIGERYRIRPITVTFSGGTVTITVPKYLLAIGTDIADVAIDLEDDANFLDHVDIYRRYNDEATEGELIWDGGMDCYGGPTSQTAELLVRSKERGFLIPLPSTYDPIDGWEQSCVDRDPDRVKASYTSGIPLDSDGQINRRWADAIAAYAAALLPAPPCVCDCGPNRVSWWREDFSVNSGEVSWKRGNATAILDNPFGPERGAIIAWQLCQRERLGGIA